MTNGMTCYERDEQACEEEVCLRSGCRLRKANSPYTPEQQRVSDYIQEITNGMIGSGDDPIGFLIASHVYALAKAMIVSDLVSALKTLLDRAERETCNHDETYRGGTIWTICSQCGRKWADDEGGFKPYQDPPEFVAARAAINAAKFFA